MLSPTAGERIAPASNGSTTRSWAIKLAREDRARAIVMWLLLILLFRQTLAGPIRAFIPVAWYLPDVGMLAAFAILIYQASRDRVPSLLVFSGLIVLIVLYSLMSNSVLAVSLQARQIGYFLLAALAGLGIRRGNTTLTKAIAISGGIAMLGVYYDHFVGVPWSDALFEGALRSKEVAREWATGANGARRLAGFGIASTDTSAIIAVGALSYCALTRSQLRVPSIIYCVASAHTLLLTTQKATAGWLLIVLLVAYVVPTLFPRKDGFSSAPVLRGMSLAGLAGCILVPAIFYNVQIGQLFDVHAPTLDQRMTEIWPVVIPELWSFPQVIAGYGLGSVGPTANFPALQIVDNMFLFMALMLGVPLAFALFGAFGYGVWNAPMRDAMDFSALAIIALSILNGITANVFAGGGVGSIYLGLAAGILLRPTRRNSSRPSAQQAPGPSRRIRRSSSRPSSE